MARKNWNGPPGELTTGNVDHAGRRFLDVGGQQVMVSCAWNDHGALCTHYGTNSDATTGQGPWYCRDHYRKLHGRFG